MLPTLWEQFVDAQDPGVNTDKETELTLTKGEKTN